MDRERLKLIVRNLELLVEGLKTEVYSDINSYNYENLPSNVGTLSDYDEVFEDHE